MLVRRLDGVALMQGWLIHKVLLIHRKMERLVVVLRSTARVLNLRSILLILNMRDVRKFIEVCLERIRAFSLR